MISDHTHHCNFCHKSKSEVTNLIVGDTAAICNECVSLCVSILAEDKESSPKKKQQTKINPVAIKDYLDEFVIGQNEAKIAISVAVSQHYKRIANKDAKIQLEKTNLLLLGPTGTGKTLMIKKVAEFLDLPFAICDATSLTEAGYVGDDVESVLSTLIAKADGDLEKAKRGIVYIDEIDKIAKKADGVNNSRDVGGEGVQQALLKMIEGSSVRIPVDSKRKNPQSNMQELDTSDILFICGGAFVGIDKIVKNRANKSNIGFTSNELNESELPTLSNKDLISFGLIPEFIGRFGLLAVVKELDEFQLVKILKEPKNSIVKQYKYMFSLDGIDLDFTNDALISIANKSIKYNTNARALKQIVESILIEYQFSAIDLSARGLKKITVTKETVNGGPALLEFANSSAK